MDTKKIRLKAYLTQEKFAKELKVSVSTVRSWEKGTFKPNITQQGKIAEFCKEKGIEIIDNEFIKEQ